MLSRPSHLLKLFTANQQIDPINFTLTGSDNETCTFTFPHPLRSSMIFQVGHFSDDRKKQPVIYIGHVKTNTLYYLYWNETREVYTWSYNHAFHPNNQLESLSDTNQAENTLFKCMQLNEAPSLFHLLLELNKNQGITYALREWANQMISDFDQTTHPAFLTAIRKLFSLEMIGDSQKALRDIILLNKQPCKTFDGIFQFLTLGLCYLHGFGTTRNFPADYVTAIEYFNNALSLAAFDDALQDLLRRQIIAELKTNANNVVSREKKAICRTYHGQLFLAIKSYSDAIAQFDIALSDGDSNAALSLGGCYESGYHDQQHLPNDQLALTVYEKGLAKTYSITTLNKLMSAVLAINKRSPKLSKELLSCQLQYITSLCSNFTPHVVITELRENKFGQLSNLEIWNHVATFLEESIKKSSDNYYYLIQFHQLTNNHVEHLKSYEQWIEILLSAKRAFDFVGIVEDLALPLSEQVNLLPDPNVSARITVLIIDILLDQKKYLNDKQPDRLISVLKLMLTLLENQTISEDKSFAACYQSMQKTIQAIFDQMAREAVSTERYEKLTEFGSKLAQLPISNMTVAALRYSVAGQIYDHHKLATDLTQFKSNRDEKIRKDLKSLENSTNAFEKLYFYLYKLERLDTMPRASRRDEPHQYLKKIGELPIRQARFAIIDYYERHQANEDYKFCLQKLITDKEDIEKFLLNSLKTSQLGRYHRQSLAFAKKYCPNTFITKLIEFDLKQLVDPLAEDVFTPNQTENEPNNFSNIIHLLKNRDLLHANTRNALRRYAAELHAKFPLLQTEENQPFIDELQNFLKAEGKEDKKEDIKVEGKVERDNQRIISKLEREKAELEHSLSQATKVIENSKTAPRLKSNYILNNFMSSKLDRNVTIEYALAKLHDYKVDKNPNAQLLQDAITEGANIDKINQILIQIMSPQKSSQVTKKGGAKK